MKCPKCGAELEKGKLYCGICGNEIQMVPDFEPEIENSITETLNTVARDAALSVSEESAAESLPWKKKPWSKKRRRIVIGAVSSVFLLGVFLYVLLSAVYQNNYIAIQVKKAQEAFANHNYLEAASLYEGILIEDGVDIEVHLSLAECYGKLEETEKAIAEYKAVIAADEHNESAYAGLIALYDEMGQYNDINMLLLACVDEKIQYEYQGYMAKQPEFNYESDTYDQVIPLKLLAPSFGKIYYTLDGSNPGKGSLIYTAPIFLRKGSYKVSAVYINDYGIASEIVRKDYEIAAQTPDNPVIGPDSGVFQVPQLITVKIPEDCNVYYTTDGSAPTENSSIYGEPIPMMTGDSTYKFVAITKEGVPGDVVSVTYQLTIETNLSEQAAIDALKYRLVGVNHLLDAEGNLENMSGKNIYVFNSLRYIDDKILYFIYEYYQEGNQSRNMTGNIYAVDAQDGRVYKATKENGGSYSIEAF